MYILFITVISIMAGFHPVEARPEPGMILNRSALDFSASHVVGRSISPGEGGRAEKHGLAGPEGWGERGWFDYNFRVASPGWYEIYSRISGKYRNAEYIIDPKRLYPHGVETRIYADGQGLRGDLDKVGNVWLSAGRHTLRIQQYFWTGLPPITRLIVKKSPDTIAGRVRLTIGSPTRVFSTGMCPDLEVDSGQLPAGRSLVIRFRDTSNGQIMRSDRLAISSSRTLEKQEVPLYCGTAGEFTVELATVAGSAVPRRQINHIRYQVVGRKPGGFATKPAGVMRKILVQDINCATTAPDFWGGGRPRVKESTIGLYLESGQNGWRIYQQTPKTLRAFAPVPSWFAYKLDVHDVGQPYMVQVTYPDNGLRTFAIALRERKPLAYPVAGGVDTGGEFAVSDTMQTQTLIFWPHSKNTRIVFMNARPGARAAVARIRVYKLNGVFPPLRIAKPGRRVFANWYEEGANFSSLYGEPSSPSGMRIAFRRWARLAAYMGINVLSPSVNVYSFVLYPSHYNRAFSEPPTDDTLRYMLLVCQEYGLKLLPDIHTRADELSWPYERDRGLKPNLLVSKDGRTKAGQPPYYNPIYPANQDWYLNMIGELVDRYRDSPALMGVNLRLMQWANPTLNNFESLDWGYGDYTVGAFEKDTGISIPVSNTGPDRFHERYEWLMTHARNAWIEWRCRKIAELYRKITDRVRRARSDLKLYTTVFDEYPSGFGTKWLKGAGIDLKMLSKIRGLVLINALYAYGRAYGPVANQDTRDNLLDSAVMNSMVAPGENGKYLFYQRYFESTGAVVPPRKLGFPESTKRTWMSAAVNPAGRNYLERYALALADSDASWLEDGGNGYTLGQPVLRDFVREYRSLPAEPFKPLPQARDPVAVWYLPRSDAFFFYAVNREYFPVTVTIRLGGAGRSHVYRLTTGDAAPARNGKLTIRLAPYQLLTFKAPPGTAIIGVTTTVPRNYAQRAKAQVDWLSALARGEAKPRAMARLDASERHTLSQMAAQAAGALRRGWIWRATTLLENHKLLPIYRKLGARPPEPTTVRLRIH